MILKKEYAKKVVEVKRGSDKVVKLETEGITMNVVMVMDHKLAVKWRRKRNPSATWMKWGGERDDCSRLTLAVRKAKRAKAEQRIKMEGKGG